MTTEVTLGDKMILMHMEWMESELQEKFSSETIFIYAK